MNAETLRQFENLCQSLFTEENSAKRKLAEQKMAPFKNVDAIAKLQLVLQQSNNFHALFYSVEQLTKLYTKYWNSIPNEEKNKLRMFLIGYLGKLGSKMPVYLLNACLTLSGRVMKLNWLADQDTRDLPEQIKKYFIHSSSIINQTNAFFPDAGPNSAEKLKQDQDSTIIGLKLLSSLIFEVNHLDNFSKSAPNFNLQKHRKISVSFRDLALRSIFETALFLLKEMLRTFNYDFGKFDPDFLDKFEKNIDNKKKDFVDKQTAFGYSEQVCNQALELMLTCLKFDFVGLFPDESNTELEDIGSIHIPSAWRPLFEESNTVVLLWKLYQIVKHTDAETRILKIIVLLCSVRRSLFSGEEERKQYLQGLINGMVAVLTTKKGLNHYENVHEFCRLLARLKTNFQLNEFVAIENYHTWLDLVAKFTVAAFKQSVTSENDIDTSIGGSSSVYYLLTLWSRLIQSKPYLKTTLECHLDNYVPEIAKQFIQSRFQLAQRLIQDYDEDPFHDKQTLNEILDTVPQLIHANYDNTAIILQSLAEQNLATFQQAMNVVTQQPNIQQPQTTTTQFCIVESHLTWLVYIIGSVIGKHYTSPNKKTETTDADLIALLLQSFNLVTERVKILHALPPSGGNELELKIMEHFEKGLLYFMKNVKKIYLSSSVLTRNNLFQRLNEKIPGLTNQVDVLNAFLKKCVSNLKIWTKSTEVIMKTLQLFEDITTSYTSGRLISKLDTISYLLKNHSMDNFPFFSNPESINFNQCMRLRTSFYKTLTNLFFQNYSFSNISPTLNTAAISGMGSSSIYAPSLFVRMSSSGSMGKPIDTEIEEDFEKSNQQDKLSPTSSAFGSLAASSTGSSPTAASSSLQTQKQQQNSLEFEFLQFLKPIETQLVNIENLFLTYFLNNPNNAQQITQQQIEKIRFMLVGLFRDLRGIVTSCSTKQQYGYFFEWFFPQHFPLLLYVIQFNSSSFSSQQNVSSASSSSKTNSLLVIALMKFLSEFVLNRNARISFDHSSGNGILLFKETANVLIEFGNQFVRQQSQNIQKQDFDITTSSLENDSTLSLAQDKSEGKIEKEKSTTSSKVYRERYKLISICMQVLTRALSGGYCNFGVFELYGDSCLSTAIKTLAYMLFSFMPPVEMKAYPKVSKTVFSFLEILFQTQPLLIMTLFPPATQPVAPNAQPTQQAQNNFLKIVDLLEYGLTELGNEDATISTSVCSAMDYVLSFYYRETFVKKNLAAGISDPSKAPPQPQIAQPTQLQPFQLFLVQKAQQQKDQARLFLHSSLNASNIVKTHFMQSGDLFPRILMKLFNIIIYEETGNQWAFSRVMLSLIVTHQQFFFNQLKPKIIETINSNAANAALAGEKQGASNNEQHMKEDGMGAGAMEKTNEKPNTTIEQAFEQLMDGIEMNLEQKNKDKFTNNVITFRQTVRDLI